MVEKGFGLYIHWPFCTRICPYCDFNIYKDRGADTAKWTDAFISEINHWAVQTPGRRLTSIYFGGGTPSLAAPELVHTVINAARSAWPNNDNIEITLEANPTDAEQARFSAFHGSGVNRLSLGIQSFDDTALQFLGRNHTGHEARYALDLALKIFGNVTFDLIYALPAQTEEAWQSSLRKALSIGAPHLSAYQLTIEPGTAFEKAVERGTFAPADDDHGAALYDITQSEAERAGRPRYEISNHASPGFESRHNLTYWRGGDYIGIGPGAHGRVTIDGTRRATETHRAPQKYLTAVNDHGHGICLDDPLSRDDVFAEKLTMGLRMQEGVSLSQLEFAQLADRIKVLQADGFIEINGPHLSASAAGQRILNSLLSTLLI